MSSDNNRTHIAALPSHVVNDRYRLTRQREIRAQLRVLMRDRNPVSVSFNDEEDALTSMVVDVHEASGLLLLDSASSMEMTRRAIESGRLVCMAKNSGVPHYFVCDSPRSVRYKGVLTIATAIPQEMYRFQQRESFRAPTPTTHGPNCLVKDPLSGKQYEMALRDISLGGVCLIDGHEEARLKQSKTYTGCILRLSKFGEIEVDLTICRHQKSVGRNGVVRHQYGAAFGKLPTPATTLLQRYIYRLQQTALQSGAS